MTVKGSGAMMMKQQLCPTTSASNMSSTSSGSSTNTLRVSPSSEHDMNIQYDVIVIGSGNGACGLLSECLKYAPPSYETQQDDDTRTRTGTGTGTRKYDYNILVLEEGQHFFQVSDITHENGWSKTYSSGKIFKLHNAVSPSGKPIISGRAVAMGGGGSINYTMMHESSTWLTKQLGKSEEYWDAMKGELNCKFHRPDPFDKKKPDFANYIECKAADENLDHPYAPANKAHNAAGNIPSLQEEEREDWEDDCPITEDGEEESSNDQEGTKREKKVKKNGNKQMYIFPTQFNDFGLRTNSGVSLVDWSDRRIEIKCLHSVKELNVDEEGTCTSVKAFSLEKNRNVEYSIKRGGRVILCGGSSSPKLLMKCKHIQNEAIGMYMKDHICMPLGIYFVAEDQKDLIGPKNNYESIFAMTSGSVADDGVRDYYTFDFYSGELDRLIFLASSLYLCFIPFNILKRLMGKYPFLFTFLSNAIRILLTVVVFFCDVWIGIKDVINGRGWGSTKIKITTSLLKFNPAAYGRYEDKGGKYTLGFFEDEKDFVTAETAIKDNLPFLESLGSKPLLPLRWIFQLITKIPYEQSQVRRYVKHFSRKALLSEQHLAGGCLFGKVVDMGDRDPMDTGKVIGTNNLHIADLSMVSLPRVSTQMTAYLIGHYVGKQIFKPKKA